MTMIDDAIQYRQCSSIRAIRAKCRTCTQNNRIFHSNNQIYQYFPHPFLFCSLLLTLSLALSIFHQTFDLFCSSNPFALHPLEIFHIDWKRVCKMCSGNEIAGLSGVPSTKELLFSKRHWFLWLW